MVGTRRRYWRNALSNSGCQEGTDEPKDVIAVPSAAVATKEALRDLRRAQAKAEEISAVPPADGVTETMPVNHDRASAMSPEADGSHEEEQGTGGSHDE